MWVVTLSLTASLALFHQCQFSLIHFDPFDHMAYVYDRPNILELAITLTCSVFVCSCQYGCKCYTIVVLQLCGTESKWIAFVVFVVLYMMFVIVWPSLQKVWHIMFSSGMKIRCGFHYNITITWTILVSLLVIMCLLEYEIFNPETWENNSTEW